MLGTWPIVRLAYRERVVQRYGVLVDLSHAVLGEQVRASLFFGLYEGSERRAVARFVDPSLPTIELGASIGFVTCFIAQRCQSVVAVEANARLLPVIQRHLSLNGLLGVSVEHAAIGYDGQPFARFSEGADTVTGNTSNQSLIEAVEVPAITLKSLVDRFRLSRYGIVCDIEGAEVGLIMCESEEVLSRCDIAIFELHDTAFGRECFTAVELAAIFQSRARMRIVFCDGKVWVFRR